METTTQTDAPMPTRSKGLINRWYVRCPGCLTVSAVEVAPVVSMVCDLCNVKVEAMGRVHRAGYMVTREDEVCACDGRCTGATGPSCNCPCGGENHGTGATVTVVVTDGIPRVTARDAAKAIARRDEFTALVDAVRALDPYGRAQYLRKSEGHYLNPSDYGAFSRYFHGPRAAIVAARKLRSHAGRVKALRAALAK